MLELEHTTAAAANTTARLFSGVCGQTFRFAPDPPSVRGHSAIPGSGGWRQWVDSRYAANGNRRPTIIVVHESSCPTTSYLRVGCQRRQLVPEAQLRVLPESLQFRTTLGREPLITGITGDRIEQVHALNLDSTIVYVDKLGRRKRSEGQRRQRRRRTCSSYQSIDALGRKRLSRRRRKIGEQRRAVGDSLVVVMTG